jgi:hypothetical protein
VVVSFLGAQILIPIKGGEVFDLLLIIKEILEKQYMAKNSSRQSQPTSSSRFFGFAAEFQSSKSVAQAGCDWLLVSKFIPTSLYGNYDLFASESIQNEDDAWTDL